MAKKTKAELEQELYEAEKEKARLNKMIKQLLDDQDATKKDYSDLYMLYEETKESEEKWLEIAEETKAKNERLGTRAISLDEALVKVQKERDHLEEALGRANHDREHLLKQVETKDAELEEIYKHADQQKQDLESIIDHWKKSAEEEGQNNKELRIVNKDLRKELESTHDNLIKSIETVEELRETVRKADEFSDKVVGELDELKKINQDLTDIANQAQREKLEAWEHVDQLDSQLSEYMREVNNLKNELKIKTTSLEYIENGLRSSEKEVMKVRKVNKNLLNYIEILASQDSPNLPDDFNF